MARIFVIVEGPTEETFVSEVLAPHLLKVPHYASAKIVGNAHSRGRRGGIKGWPSAKFDIVRHLRDEPDLYVTTMVDYYALPQSGQRAWPGRAEAGEREFADKAPTVMNAIHAEVQAQFTGLFDSERFVPYVMMHEFEGLLFSDCEAFARGIGMPHLAPRFEEIAQAYDTPEEINDSPETSPSHRIEDPVPRYEKPFMGTLAALEIGLDRIRAKCPLFDAWMTTLEGLP